MGCGSSRESPSDVKIVGGSLVSDSSEDPARVSTVALTNAEAFSNGKSFCTAVLIEPSILLTAAHCVFDEDTKGATSEKIIVVFSTKVGASDAEIRDVAAIEVNPTYQYDLLRDGEDPEKKPMNDLAVIRLSEAAPSTYQPVQIVPENTKYSKDQELILAGYGVTETRTRNDTGTLREVAVDIVKDDTAGKVLIVKGPDLGVTAIVPPENDNAEPTTRPADGGACAGDSGGPAYLHSRSRWFVAGITSYGEEFEVKGRPAGVTYCAGLEGYVDLRKHRSDISALISKVK